MRIVQNLDSSRNGKAYIPYSRQWLTKKDIARVIDSLNSDWIAGDGPITKRFEAELAEKTGFKYAVAVNSGTAALHIAVEMMRFGVTHISVPALTFVATANVVELAGLTVVLEDVHKRKLVNGDCQISVDYAGYPSGGSLIVDAAHSLRPSMNNGNNKIVCVSFHATKNSVVSGEGGALLTDDDIWHKHALQLRAHGQGGDKNTVRLGWNYRMPDFCAALARSQLEELEVRLARRRQIAEYYIAEFERIPEIELPAWDDNHTWHLFPIRLNSRNGFRLLLNADGIETRVHFLPIYRHPYYASRGIDPANFPNTEEAYKRLVSIPIFYGMKDSEVEEVVESVKRNVQ